jgi:diguanylate cyclase (GGDEF)-like protein/PAS domain S-box-containing protein
MEGTPGIRQAAAGNSGEEALRDSEERLRRIVAVLDEGIVVYGRDGTITACNASAERILGVTTDDIIGRGPPAADSPPAPLAEVTLEDGTPLTADTSHALRALRTGEAARGVVVRMRREDGQETWISVNYQPLMREGESEPHGVVASMTDITEARRAERELRAQRDRAAAYFELAGALLVAIGPDACVQLANRHAASVLGYGVDEMVGRDWFEDFQPPEEREAGRAAFGRIISGEIDSLESESRVVTKAGEERLVTWRCSALRDEDGELVAVIGSGEDVTEQRKEEAQVAYLAYHDRLTGLPNRTLLEEHLELGLARARRASTAVALMYMDLDNFKLVNDSLGHAAGDRVLGQVAERLREALRASDLLARQGGDEFLLLVTDIEGDPRMAAEAVAASITQALERPFEVQGAEFHIGASIGVSLFPRDAHDGDTLLRHADAAMYQGKRGDRGRVTFYAEEGRDALRRLSMATLLGKAVAHDEFVLHYQPIVSLDDGSIDHVEALIRWCDPEHGLVMPGDFIPVAEETGLIEAIGDWVIEEVCDQLLAWREQGLEPAISFNVSPRQLRRGDLVERVSERLASAGVEASRLVMEVTETAAMQDAPERVERVLRDLAEMGFRIAIDDFGSGWSSLARLRSLPVRMLKIDRSFLKDVPADPVGCAFVRAVVEFGASVGLTTVAEGVETEAQREFLLGAGCGCGQGFHLGRPVPAAEAARLISG